MSLAGSCAGRRRALRPRRKVGRAPGIRYGATIVSSRPPSLALFRDRKEAKRVERAASSRPAPAGTPLDTALAAVARYSGHAFELKVRLFHEVFRRELDRERTRRDGSGR